MTYQEEMYAHLVHGGDPQVLLDAFMKDLNEAQKKADAQLEKEKQEAEATTKREKTLKHYREAVIAAFTPYLTLVLGEEIHEDIIRASIVELEEAIAAIKSIKISINGDELKSIFDLFV